MEFQSQREPVVVDQALDGFLDSDAIVFQGVLVNDVRRETDCITLGLAQNGLGLAIDRGTLRHQHGAVSRSGPVTQVHSVGTSLAEET
eukprot:4079419-Pyramimonas_sp.AAC.1